MLASHMVHSGLTAPCHRQVAPVTASMPSFSGRQACAHLSAANPFTGRANQLTISCRRPGTSRRQGLTVQCALRKVALLGAAGGIGQPLALLLKMQPLISELALYDIANTVGVAADLSHCNTPVQVRPWVPTSSALPASKVSADSELASSKQVPGKLVGTYQS